jgi:hypothetical protein
MHRLSVAIEVETRPVFLLEDRDYFTLMPSFMGENSVEEIYLKWK